MPLNSEGVMDYGDPEKCAECGDSVKWGSGKFVNRVPIFDDYPIRRDQGRPFPQGAYICDECICAIEEEMEREQQGAS